jgi:hypothetical protein
MINLKPTLSGIALLFCDKRELSNKSSVSCPTLIDCASCHNLYLNCRTGLYGNPLHQNQLKEVFEENIIFVILALHQQEWVVGNHCFS